MLCPANGNSPRESVGFLKDSSLYFAISFAKIWVDVPANLARTGLHVSATQIPTVSLATAQRDTRVLPAKSVSFFDNRFEL